MRFRRRAVVEMCDGPLVHNLITVGAPHQGVYGLPFEKVFGIKFKKRKKLSELTNKKYVQF